ncbi:MAG: nuclear transport factor 2 family protein [Flavobacteriales bacterium]|nr:nuclear transport factor 2 family protein [Flavobacteriales bacterium]MCX7767555.1 nuclear transport factor 2 family protein [Flavobacteriales bacterium]MDW8410085.1 nuclear transport factor 2 family protein [Flavobacteriales bacterium]
MARWVIFLCIVAVVVWRDSSFCFGQIISEEVLRKLVLQKFELMQRKSLDSLSKLLHPEARYIHSNGWIQKKSELIEDVRVQKLVLTRVQVDSLKAWGENKTLCVMGWGTFEGFSQQQPFQVRLLFTETYHRKGRRWLLLCRQALRI